MIKLLRYTIYAAIFVFWSTASAVFALQTTYSNPDDPTQVTSGSQTQSEQQAGQGSTPMGQTGNSAPMGRTGSSLSGINPLTPNGLTPNAATPNPGEHVDAAGLDRTRNQANPLQARPSPPTNFQLLAQHTLGESLPLFGRTLFRTPTTFAALPDAPPTTDYVISTGDQVLVRMWGPITMNEALTVDRAGDIYLPQVGTVHVAGLSYAALSGHLHNEVSRVFRNFNLSVDLGRLHSIQVFVTGQAERPGTYTISSLSTLVNAVFASGGPSPAGSLRRIELRRDGQVVTTFDFYDLLVHGDKSKDVHLLPGDVIFIPPVGAEVAFGGEVKVPAVYELRAQETLGTLLEFAGGPTTVASAVGISVQQIVNHDYRETQTLPLTPTGLATVLKDGDVLALGGISHRIENTVTIRGNLANPGRFAWHVGMRLSDILPEKSSLLTANYWEFRNAEGRPNPFFEAAPPSTPREYSSGNPLESASSNLPSTTGTGSRPATQQNLAGDVAGAAVFANGQTLGTTQSPNGDQGNATPYTNNDTSNATSSMSPFTAPSTSSSTSANRTGSEARPTDRSITMEAAPLNRVSIPAPEIDWSYAVIERTTADTLRNQLVPFHLGKLVLDHDQSQNLVLEPGDVVTIFSQNDFHVAQEQRTKFVRVEGEVTSAGVYSVLPGETLQSLVERAGGLTPQAYLFGAQFTRESTRALQQQRIEEYVSRLSVELDRSTANQALAITQVGNNSTVLTVEERLLAQLRAQRAIGRIVLDFNLDSQGVRSIPPVPLENGDVLVVPSRPAVVSVIGSVANQNSFLFNPGATVKYYLGRAGGPDRDSDPKRAFVIRANGSVLSRRGSGFWGDTFNGLQLAPGDTLVIPAKLFNVSPLRTILESSSAFAQIGLLGVAATR